jgi:glucan 1,3-beta-glucosidase
MATMSKALRGINLGGWLVAERWMTPRLFDGVEGDGERSLGYELGLEEAARRLAAHRDTFITEDDFRWIADHGFSFVRLPVGYWLFEDSPGYISGERYVKHAFAWAKTYHLGVVLDFHGLQGSQNGHDHSGEAGKTKFYRRGNRRSALATMEYLAKTYGQEQALLGMEVINEPKVHWFLWRLLRYYDRAYAIAEQYTRSDVKIIVSDAYRPLKLAKALAKRRYGNRLVLDVHLYQVFGSDDSELTLDEHTHKVQAVWAPLLAELKQYVPNVLVGEWSAALPPAAYEAAGGEQPKLRAKYHRSQAECFESNVWAESYWSYKAPGAGAWDYRSTHE